MATKKANTTTETTTSQPTREQLRQQLAQDLASILANPETPATLYNAIADELCEFSEAINYNTAEMIERSLNAYCEKEEKRTGR